MRTETLAQKRQTLHRAKTTAETRKYFMLTRTLAEKGWLLLLPKPMPKKEKPILKTYKANLEHREKKTTLPIKTTVDQNASQKPWSRFQRLGKTNLKLRQRRKHRQTKKPRTWKPACWKNIWPENVYLKNVVAKAGNIFLRIENRHTKKWLQPKNETCESKTYLVF